MPSSSRATSDGATISATPVAASASAAKASGLFMQWPVTPYYFGFSSFFSATYSCGPRVKVSRLILPVNLNGQS